MTTSARLPRTFFHTPASGWLRQHAWVALAIAAVTLAFFTGIDYGNALGAEDWMHVYRTCVLHNPQIAERPFSLLSLVMLCPFLKSDTQSYYYVLIAFRAVSAFMVYLLIWQISPGQPLFAFTCGVASSVFQVRDTFFLHTFLQQVDHVFSLALTLLSLNVFIAYLHSEARWRYRASLLILSLLLGGFTPLVREATLPLLFAIPLLVSLADRDISRPRLIGLALWYATVLLTVIYYIVGFRQAHTTYIQVLFQDVDPVRMLIASRDQLYFAFRYLLQLTVTDVYQSRLVVLVMAALTSLSVWGFYYCWDGSRPEEAMSVQRRRAIFWLLAGLAAAWLGLAAFLPTMFATTTIRTHILSTPGEAVALMGFVWLVSSLFHNVRWQMGVKLAGVTLVAISSAALAGRLQTDLYSYAATWDNTAYFLRSLAHLAPAVKPNTLFIYIENRETEETPFVSGFSFQYAIRYFYGDTAAGLLPSDSILGKWSVSDAGVFMEENWIEQPHTYGWNEIIVFTREASGHLIVLDQLPERFLTAYRQGLYHPRERIEPAFINARIQETFPILSGPDWSENDYLLQNR